MDADISTTISQIAVVDASNTFLEDLLTKTNSNSFKVPKNGSISIRNLRFKYDDKFIFKNLNLEIDNKDKVAIIGRSGSGKTTLLKLILKLHTYEGIIKIDNIDTTQIGTESLRDNILYINQRTKLLDKPVIENIKYGTTTNDKYIIKFLKKYKLMNIFSNLKNGVYEEVLVGGSNLSLGMQKIIILVRGILKIKNSLIVMFDEPLAGLDKKTRELVMNMISNECTQKTLIIITHDMEIKSIVNRTINIESIKNNPK